MPLFAEEIYTFPHCWNMLDKLTARSYESNASIREGTTYLLRDRMSILGPDIQTHP